MSEDDVMLGLDLGGTEVKGLAFNARGERLAQETRATRDGAGAEWIENVRAVAAALRERCRGATRIGLCAPGLAARDERTIVSMPGRLQGLEGLVWSEVLGLPTRVINDAHAALLGECWLGAARGATNVLMVTLGTGVGGAAMVDGRLLRGHLGRAGHVGHISLDPDGAPDIVRTPGSLEDAIGECTLQARGGGRFGSTRALVAAATAGDAAAQEIWQRSIRALAVGLVGLINVLDPEKIVIGGGIAAAGEALFEPLRREVAAREWRVGGASVEIVPAELGSTAGACGAAWRARQEISS